MAQSLLGAAEEEDIPAVVQSLLSMATVSTAPKVAATLRAECARVQPDTLRLTVEARPSVLFGGPLIRV